jgi:hypothetical protein
LPVVAVLVKTAQAVVVQEVFDAQSQRRAVVAR